MGLIIEKLDGTQYNLSDLDIRVVDFNPDSPEVINTTVELDGGGHVVVESKYGLRTLSCICRFIGRDMGDYFLLMHEVFSLFNGVTPFYITNPFEGGVRWKVRTNGKYTPSRRLFSGDFTLAFICEPGLAESIGTSLDLQDNGNWDSNLWGFGSGINYDLHYNYTFASNSFVVKNLGNELVDPRISMLDIMLKGTFSSQVKITNQTTGDVFIYNGSLASTDELKLTGIRTLKNGVSALKNTNKKLLTLLPGDNSFIVEGGTISTIAFNFKFLYK